MKKCKRSSTSLPKIQQTFIIHFIGHSAVSNGIRQFQSDFKLLDDSQTCKMKSGT